MLRDTIVIQTDIKDLFSMASISETGHAVNIANFKKIIDRCTEFLTNYNPPNADITVANMTAKWTAVDTLHNDYLAGLDDTKLPINDREILFEQLDRTVVRTRNLYECTKASSQSKKDAKGFVRKIVGSNVKIPKLENDVPDPNYVSNSQQSYVKKVDNLSQLVNLYKTDANYIPNETDLTIASLDTLLANLRAANLNVGQLVSHAITLRTDRNHGLYDVDTGVIDISLACKKYVMSLYGAKSPEAKSVTGIYLKRIMKIRPV
jgi:hypothetical protein